MSLYNFAVERITLPLSDALLHRSITRHFRFLQESQWWSETELRAYQEEKLRQLIRHAYHNVPYYRAVLEQRRLRPEDIRTVGDLRKLPILTKEDIRRHFPDGIVDPSFPRNRVVRHASSGSTGEPLRYYVSSDAYSFNIACNLRGWYWMGFRLGDRFLKVSQYPRPLQKRLQDLALRTRYASSADLSEASFRRMVGVIRRYRPKVVRCYPDPLLFMARHMEEHGITDIRPDVITTTGNMLLPQARETIERVFQAPIFDSYRCEGGPNAFESPTHDCYISSMEYGIAEVLDSDGEEVAEGEAGTLVVTDLHNYAMPFIRYRSQDLVVKHRGKSGCGRQHVAFTRIEGRHADALMLPNGQYLILIHFVDYFDKFASVDQFQIVQTAPDRLQFRLRVNGRYSGAVEREIMTYWEAYTGGAVHIDIEQVEEIPLTRMGKRRFLLRADEVPAQG